MKFKFHPIFRSLLSEYPFGLIDVGARGGLLREWKPFARYMKCVAFEPDPVEYKRLTDQSSGQTIAYHNSALWDIERELNLFVTQREGLSSCYEPNQAFLKHFSESNTRGYAVKKTIAMKAKPLDDFIRKEDRDTLDFLKVDVEGGAAQVLRGAEKTLCESTLCGVQVEAEFNPKYRGQPLLSHVDQQLRLSDFELYEIETCSWKRRAGLKTGGGSGQLIHGNCIYFRSLDRWFASVGNLQSSHQTAKVFKFIALACVYEAYDLACEILEESVRRGCLPEVLAGKLRVTLMKSNGVLARIPKLRGRGLVYDFLYHSFMLITGIWLEKAGYWKPNVEI